MKIVIDEDIPFIRDIFESHAEVMYLPGSSISAKNVHDADALIVRTRTLCNEQLLKNSQVKFIATATIGFDHIDTGWCKQNNIQWTSAAGCNAKAVVQYVLCALLELIKDGKLQPEGKTLGIVGVGNVGSKLAIAAENLGFKVLQHDPPRAEKEGSTGFCSMETLLEADIISLHVPLNREGKYKTYHWADNHFFNKLKPGTIFINSSRGEVTNENALLDVIGNLGAVVLDVWENEPHINRILLEKVDLATPHIAGYSAQGKSNATEIVVNKLADYFGLNIQYKSPLLLPEDAIEVLQKGSSYWELMHYLMQKTYNIKEDNANLRTYTDNFEKLRKEYNYRNEPVAYKLKSKNIPQEYHRTIRELGFTFV